MSCDMSSDFLTTANLAEIRPTTLPNRPLRIAIIAHYLYPIAQPYAGGLEMITQLLCDEMEAQGHEVLLYAHEDSQTQATLVPFLTRDEFDATVYDNEHESLGMSREELYQYLVYQSALRDLIDRDARGEIDIVHNHSLHHIPMMTGQAFGERFFTTFHTPIFPQLRLALLTLRHGTKTQFTAISQHQQQLFSEFVPSQVVYNGIDVASFVANIDVDTASDANSEHESYFWYGRICPEKGTHLAMQYCMEAGKKLIIAGPKSNEEYFNEYVAPLLAEDCKYNESPLFDYVGHVTKDEVNRYLCQATAMLFTSTWDEPYGLILAESLACGTPVIGFNVGASAEIVTPDTGIIVPKEDKAAFIRGFSEIKHISRQACRNRAVAFCSVSAMVEGYLALYQTAVSKRQQILDSNGQKSVQASTHADAQESIQSNAQNHDVRQTPNTFNHLRDERQRSTASTNDIATMAYGE